MRGITLRTALLALVVLASASPAFACPMCNEAVPANSHTEEDDQARLARAYNRSIYLMVGMPYFLLSVVGFLVYRGLKQRARFEQAAASAVPLSSGKVAAMPDQGQGAQSCSPSPGVTS
jgi:hypothetical protein